MRLERLEVLDVTCLAKTAMSSLKESEEHTSPPATPGSRGVHVASSHFSKTRASRGNRGWLQRQQTFRSTDEYSLLQVRRDLLHFTLRVKKLCFGLQWFGTYVELKQRAPVYRDIVLSARLTFARQFAKQIKMHKLMRKTKCNACTKKIIITPTKSFRKKNYHGKEKSARVRYEYATHP